MFGKSMGDFMSSMASATSVGGSGGGSGSPSYRGSHDFERSDIINGKGR